MLNPPLPLVRSKLTPPALPPDILRRPQLTERLATCLRRRLTLISAPAGYGKTTLLAEWLAPVPSTLSPVPSLAWLTLDAADNDLKLFLSYLAAALAQLHPHGRPYAANAVMRGILPPVETLLADMLNDLAEVAEQSLLVLDDYHLITTPEFHHAVAFVVDHLPPRAHLLIATNVCSAGDADEDCAARSLAAQAAGIPRRQDDFPAAIDGKAYALDFPDGTPARCNPVTAPPQCTSLALEDL